MMKQPSPLALIALGIFTLFSPPTFAKMDPGTLQDVGASTEYKFYENGGDGRMTPSQLIGREIWMKATAGNSKFHMYVLSQRIGFYTDWYGVLRTDERYDNDESKTNRFKKWGLINDPECCTPGEAGCKAKTLDETYGFDYCEGDDQLLKFIGKRPGKNELGYQDPACELPNPEGKTDLESACNLAFGTSAGAMGFRKFPNPDFNPETWKKIGGWEGFRAVKDGTSRLTDGAIEPPFRVGITCGSCHIAFSPTNPPADVLRPKMENLNAAIANQYIRISEVLGSGMPKHSIEWQVFTHARPGTSDTSAVPNDQNNNPGTINAIINLDQRPTFPHDVNTWRKVDSCDAKKDSENCWCHPKKKNDCWERKLVMKQMVNHILKGGEDSVGEAEAVQRVYINIGSCAEQCWVNHFTDLRVLNPHSRNYGQTPFNINQCRKDCSNFRAIEDRVGEIRDFLFSRRPFELYDALAVAGVPVSDKSDLEEYIENDRGYGEGTVKRGKEIFAQQCATCHSSQGNKNTNFAGVDFHKPKKADGKLLLDNDGKPVRLDWMGNDDLTAQEEIGTYTCRAIHSNHMQGHIYEEYGSDTMRLKPDVTPNDGIDSFGGRGYLRNVSLLSLWAQAPFMHNNAIGPELCGDTKEVNFGMYKSPYKKGEDKACVPYDPSVEGRIRLFEASVDELLTPSSKRPKKTTVTDAPISITMGPKIWEPKDGGKERQGIEMNIPAETPVGLLGSFKHKTFFNDLRKSREEGSLENYFEKEYGKERGKILYEHLQGVTLFDDDHKIKSVDPERIKKTLTLYSNCIAGDENPENKGHDRGTDLNPEDKKALKAFLLTL